MTAYSDSPADKQRDNVSVGPQYAGNIAEELPRPASDTTMHQTARLWVSPSSILSRDHLFCDVDPSKSSIPLAAFCFMTGFM